MATEQSKVNVKQTPRQASRRYSTASFQTRTTPLLQYPNVSVLRTLTTDKLPKIMEKNPELFV